MQAKLVEQDLKASAWRQPDIRRLMASQDSDSRKAPAQDQEGARSQGETNLRVRLGVNNCHSKQPRPVPNLALPDLEALPSQVRKPAYLARIPGSVVSDLLRPKGNSCLGFSATMSAVVSVPEAAMNEEYLPSGREG